MKSKDLPAHNGDKLQTLANLWKSTGGRDTEYFTHKNKIAPKNVHEFLKFVCKLESTESQGTVATGEFAPTYTLFSMKLYHGLMNMTGQNRK